MAFSSIDVADAVVGGGGGGGAKAIVTIKSKCFENLGQNYQSKNHVLPTFTCKSLLNKMYFLICCLSIYVKEDL